MAIRITVTVSDWDTAKKYGCRLSYNEFKKLYEVERAGLSNVVKAWCEHFMEKKK